MDTLCRCSISFEEHRSQNSPYSAIGLILNEQSRRDKKKKYIDMNNSCKEKSKDRILILKVLLNKLHTL
jgi:hypothetical protein